MRNFLGLLRTDYVTLYGVCSFPRYVFHYFFNGGTSYSVHNVV